MYRSYSVNNMPQPIIKRSEPTKKPTPKPPPVPEKCGKKKQDGILGVLQNDDIILLVVIAVLLLDDCDDKLLIAALGFIFLSGVL